MSSRSHAYVGTPIGREMEAALKRINGDMQRAVVALTEYTHSIDQTIAMLFHDEDIAKATAAKGIVRDPYSTMSYPLPDVSLGLDYDHSHCMPLQTARFQPNPVRILPLYGFVRAVEAIYLQYEGVKGVLRWLNKNATAGAIRYYFPTVMQLCPATFAGMDIPQRHGTPAGVHDWLQPMRDAANTVASAVMLPNDVALRPRQAMWLTFSSRTVKAGEQNYGTDQITFNL